MTNTKNKVTQAVAGAQFPAAKNDLVQQAQQNGADQETIQSIQKLQQDKFNDMNEVERACQ